MNSRNLLVIHYLFILFAFTITLLISHTLYTEFSLIWALMFIGLLVIFMTLWVVKVLLAPLFLLSKRLDTALKETLHELNIPVATILANATMLDKKSTDVKQKRQIERINEAAQHLLELHKSLEYTIKREFKAPSKLTLNLEAFLLRRIDHYKSIYSHALFTTHLETCTIVVDAFELQKSIDNLISNAVKYAVGTPKISIVLSKCQLTIEDHGKGIDETKLLHIFERYYQTDTAQEGVGIGLSVVKSFCDRHGIVLSISSKVNAFTKIVLNFHKIKE